LERSYLTTMSLLIIHQIDAAFWHEWEMFLLPGGIQGYLLFNVIVIPVVLLGYKSVVQSDSMAPRYAYFCAVLGTATFVIHSGFFLFDYEKFTLPLSLIVILMCLISSIWLIVEIKKASRGE